MVFQVDAFRGMKKEHIKWNANFLFISKDMQKMWLVKVTLIWFYRFLFFICKLEIFNFLATVDNILRLSSEKNIDLFYHVLWKILQSWAVLFGLDIILVFIIIRSFWFKMTLMQPRVLSPVNFMLTDAGKTQMRG